MRKKGYDFCGYATKNDLICADGRIIRQNAFEGNDGMKVPMVWNHRHDDPEMVIGHALLENRPDGVFAYCKFNDTQRGRTCKKILENEDLKGVSIYANRLVQKGGEVFHGVIQELSLVLQPANPGALIDYSMSHADEDDPETLYAYMIYDLDEIVHSDSLEDDEEDDDDEKPEEKEEEPMKEEDSVKDEQCLSHADEDEKDEKETKDSDETVEDIFNTLTDKQKTAVYAVIAAVAEDEGDEEDDDDEEKNMKHNLFEDSTTTKSNTLSHADQKAILDDAKVYGSFRDSLRAFCDQNELQHDAISSGFTQDTSVTGNITYMFPEYKNVRPGAPELITNDQGWISTVLNGCHKSPVSRIRTNQVDIRNLDSLRARGYVKGKEKQLMGNFAEARRETDPQTIYVYGQLFRDDIVDITDFDYVQYLYNIQRLELNEELAMAILLGDFRTNLDQGKIQPTHIRPIWTDDDLYTIHKDVDIAAMRETLQGTETGSYFGDNYVYAESIIQAALYAREDYKGTGSPAFFIHPHTLNVMLLARDRNGRRIFSGKDELASALNVSGIHTVEQFDNRVRTDSDAHQHKLLGMMVNLADYTIGHTKGGEITHFTDFDLKFNAQQSLLETRLSGTLTRLWSAIVLEEPVA